MTNKCTANIGDVTKDIIKIKIEMSDTLESCMSKFFEVMNKHQIKQGTPAFNNNNEEVGVTCNNFEWTMCTELFYRRIIGVIEIDMLFNVPDEIAK